MHTPSADTLPYEEVQELPWPFMVLGLGGGALGGLAAARALTLAARLGIAGVAAAGLGVAVGEFLAPLRVTLLPSELQVRFGRRTRFRIPLRHVLRAYARRYRPLQEYGGWGIRMGRQGRAFSLRGNHGVQLVLRSGASVLIGSQNAEELAAAIRRITGCLGDPDSDQQPANLGSMEPEVIEVLETTVVVESLEVEIVTEGIDDDTAGVDEPEAPEEPDVAEPAEPDSSDRYEV